MKSIALIIALACSGCFTTWAAMQAGGRSLAWDENAREESVPLPATDELLTVSLSMQGRPSLSCKAAQHARETVYRSSFRYGKSWKKAMALAFVAEAAFATGMYFGTRSSEKPEDRLAGKVGAGFFALDAIGTAALFFAPRKETFSHVERDANTQLREDCPEGLTLEIAGTTYPVDAAGHIGEAGEVALEDWTNARTGTLLVGYAGRVNELRPPAYGGSTSTTLFVPLGTLTAIAQ